MTARSIEIPVRTSETPACDYLKADVIWKANEVIRQRKATSRIKYAALLAMGRRIE